MEEINGVRCRVRCAGLVVQDESLLMVRFDDPDNGDHWQVPGGGLEDTETITACAAREVVEETGLEVAVGPLAYVRQSIELDFHGLSMYFWCTQSGGAVGVGQRLTDEEERLMIDVRFVHRDETLTAPVIPPELWRRMWNDRDAGVREPIYLGVASNLA